MRFLTWCNDPNDEKCQLFFKSAEYFGIEVSPIGVGQEYKNGITKINWLWQALQKIDQSEIVVCSDSFDCLYTRSADYMESMFWSLCDPIIYSAERWGRRTDPRLKGYFEILQERQIQRWEEGIRIRDSIYRYLNAGCVVGICRLLRDFLCLSLRETESKVFEQDVISTRIAMSSESKAALDYQCELFWCCGGEWNKVPRLGRVENGMLKNRRTGTFPFIFHAPIPNRSKNLREDIAKKLGII